MLHKTEPVLNLDQTWNELCDDLFAALPHFSSHESFVRRSKVTKLVGLLPFIAGTQKPWQDAFQNLSLYMLASYGPSKTLYAHTPLDDESVFTRLKPINHFTGGNQALIKRGMALIALVLLNDYKKDKAEDIITGHYNPLNSGAWDYEEKKEQLKEIIQRTPSDDMDKVISLEIVPFEFWRIDYP